MWLLDTFSLTLKFFNDPLAVGGYAILSHTWGEEEVTFQDMANPAAAAAKKGWAKIKATCEIARRDHNLFYAWVDTCCIDKSSSAELSEAINSMFSWYKEADLCIAYLEDYILASLQVQEQPSKHGDNLSSCRWFTRGWTLQELIAPRDVLFYNASWASIGSKRKSIPLLSEITGINADVLWDLSCLEHCHVAMRMSWAAKRKTTRVEDIAYCLLGIFDISMPLLYGEGEKAFLRLQERIAESRNDLTLFAWRQPMSESSYHRGPFCNLSA
jgi:hypothetical protein